MKVLVPGALRSYTGELHVQADGDTLALLDDTMERASHGRMIIFLASRLSTLRNVDRVFLLHEAFYDATGHALRPVPEPR